MEKKMKDIFQYVLALIIIVGEIAMVFGLLYLWNVGVSSEETSIVNMVYGICFAYHSAFMLVLGYFYASTKGSSEKTEIMSAAMLPKPPRDKQ